jgi:hypothetical protein
VVAATTTIRLEYEKLSMRRMEQFIPKFITVKVCSSIAVILSQPEVFLAFVTSPSSLGRRATRIDFLTSAQLHSAHNNNHYYHYYYYYYTSDVTIVQFLCHKIRLRLVQSNHTEHADFVLPRASCHWEIWTTVSSLNIPPSGVVRSKCQHRIMILVKL